MWEYSDTEFIKTFRKILNWEWYTDVPTFKLFMHCLLKANWKPGKWHGYEYERGQFITSLQAMANETGLTVQEVRTALKHLKQTGELTDWHDSKVRIVTVLSFDRYQGQSGTDVLNCKQLVTNTKKSKKSTGKSTDHLTGKEKPENVENISVSGDGDSTPNRPINSLTNNLLTSDQQATNNRYKNNKNNKELEEENISVDDEDDDWEDDPGDDPEEAYRKWKEQNGNL